MSSKVLNISMDGDSTTSLGNLVLGVTTLTVKVLSCVQMKFCVFWFVPIDTILSLSTTDKCLSLSSHIIKISPQSHHLHTEQSHLAQPLLVCQML